MDMLEDLQLLLWQLLQWILLRTHFGGGGGWGSSAILAVMKLKITGDYWS